MKEDDWQRELTVFKKEFIEAQAWNEKQTASYIRDAWACLRDGRLAILPSKGEVPNGALPAFQFRTPQGWRLPVLLQLHLSEQLRPQAEPPGRGPQPRERVLAMIAEQGPPPEGPLPKGPIKESELKRILAQQAASDLEDICDSDELQTAGSSFWLAVLAAIRFGRRQLLAEIFADEEAIEENMRGRLMNRKGKSAKGRKRAEFSTDAFREVVQELVTEGWKMKKNPEEMWAFARSSLWKKEVRKEGPYYIYHDDTARAKEATVQKWVRQGRKKLTF